MKKITIITIMLLVCMSFAIAEDSQGAINEYTMHGKTLNRQDWDFTTYPQSVINATSPAISFGFHVGDLTVHDGLLYVPTTDGLTRMNASDISQPIIDSNTLLNGDVSGEVSSPIVANDYVYQTGKVGNYYRIYQYALNDISTPLYQNTCSWYNPRSDVYQPILYNDSGNMYVYCQGPAGGMDIAPAIPVNHYETVIYQYDANNVGNLISTYSAGPSIATIQEDSGMAAANGYIYLGEKNGDTIIMLDATNIATEVASGNHGGSTLESASPIIAGGYAYFTGYDGTLYQTLDSQPSVIENLFDTTTDNRLINTPAISGDYIYVSVASAQLVSDQAKVYQLYKSNLSLVSQFNPGSSTGAGFGPPTVSDGIVYIHHTDGLIYELNANNVSEVFRSYPAISGTYEDHSLAVTDNYVYFWQNDTSIGQVARIPAPTSCTPEWSCIGYEVCVSPAPNVSCNLVTDLNTCGDVYAGNYSEFTPQNCTYSSGGGGGGWPDEEEEAPTLEIIPVEETDPFLNFRGLFEQFSILYQKLFKVNTTSGEATTNFGNYLLESIILLVVLGSIIGLAVASQEEDKKNKKKKNNKKTKRRKK